MAARAWAVWRRDADVYLVTWKTNMLPPLMEPFLFLAAFGAGLGTILTHVIWNGVPITYAAFIAPGLVAASVMNQAFFENTYSTFVRMFYQKTFDALLSTPLTVNDILLGEVLWGATKALFTGIVMLLVIAAFGLLHHPTAFLVVPLSLLIGLMFSGLALCCTARAPTIDAFNFPIYLLISPMYVFSGTFFPLDVLPPWGRALAWTMPLTHAVATARELTQGRVTSVTAVGLGYMSVFTAVSLSLGIRWMRRRLVR